MSLMVTARPWDRPSPRATKELGPLTDEQRAVIFRFFRERYPSGGITPTTSSGTDRWPLAGPNA
jgi:hypothetical protein